MNEKNTFVAWLGFKATPNFLKSRTIGSFVGVVILLFTLTVFAFAAIGLVKALSLYAFGDSTEAPSAAVRNIGLLLVGLFGAPFVAWQAIVRQKQVDIADNVLFNDKLNDANNDLHARYQTSEKQDDGTYIDIWKDDIIRRNGAIDRLEALAIERPSMAPRIARMLCVYVQELSSTTTLINFPQNATAEEIHTILNTPFRARTDVQSSINVIGKMRGIAGKFSDQVNIDLSSSNLQSVDFSNLDLTGANFSTSIMHRAYFNNTRLNGVDFTFTNLTGAKIAKCDLACANFSHTYLYNMGLIGGSLDQAIFDNCKPNQLTEIRWVNASALAFKNIDVRLFGNFSVIPNGAVLFGDASVAFHDLRVLPEHWPDTDLDPDQYDNEWKRFKQDPEAYIPPQLRKD